MASDYFSNHERVRRFPWSLYHRPLEDDLTRFLEGVAAGRPGADVLVIGCGLMHELDRVPQELQFTLADIDPRAIEAVLSRKDSRVKGAHVVAPEIPPDPSRCFQAIYAKEVIEHIVDPKTYLLGLRRILVPGGRLWLSTPNYGEPWLPLLEGTVLEVIAWRSGFTRKGLHPSRFSRASLASALAQAGFSAVNVYPTVNRLALLAHASVGRPPEPVWQADSRVSP